MAPFWDDVRFGLRLLWRHPSFSILALLTLAVGIGANTAVFSVVRSVLLKPLPYRQPEKLFWFGGRETHFGTEGTGISIPNFQDVRRQSRTMATVAAYSYFADNYVATGLGEPQLFDGTRVTAEFFDVLGVPPEIGRTFRPGEDVRGGPSLVVISHDLWVRSFAADPHVTDKTLILNSVSHQIVGVMPAGFAFPSPVDIWKPFAIGTQNTILRATHSYLCIARLKEAATPELASEELESIAAGLERDFPDSNAGYRFDGMTLASHVTGSVRDTLYLLLGITGFLLLIGAASVANLLLSRATGRKREIAIRHALGAPRIVIVRQLVSESLILAIAGGALGSILAWWIVRLLRGWNPAALPRAAELSLDVNALFFALAISMVTALLFGLAPALQSTRGSQAEALRDSGARGGGEGAGRVRVRTILVAGEIALAVVLLAGAGLLLESLRQLLAVDPGFRTANVVDAQITLPFQKYGPEAWGPFVETYLDRLRALPGVRSAGAAMGLPMDSGYSFFEFRVAGDPPPPVPPYAGYTAVGPGYFETLGIPLRQGRFFSRNDNRQAPRTVVISEPMARQYFGGRQPLGRHLQIYVGGPDPIDAEIIGVAGGVRHQDLAQEPRVEMYVSFLQTAYPVAHILVSSRLSLATLASAMKGQLKELDPDLPLYQTRTMEEVVLNSAAGPRARGFLTGLFAAVALLLASIGIYGVMSYSVSRRIQEIGIRMAVGATPAQILRMILAHSGKLVVIGVGCGLILTLALGRLITNLLYGVSAFSPLVLGLVCLLLGAVAITASFVPAWRASRVDPLLALRQE